MDKRGATMTEQFVEIQCTSCGTLFRRCLGEVNRQKKRGHKPYCSRACGAAGRKRPRDRIFSRTKVTKLGCWEYTGSLNKTGYGTTRLDGAPMLAHRVGWILAHGPIEGGLHVLHKCDNPKCINPNHLFLGTHADNMADMHAKGRSRAKLATTPPEAQP